jgi:hypothetical protein
MQAKYHFCVSIAVFFVFILGARSLWAQPVSKDVCLSCHGVPGLEKRRDGKTISLQVDKGSFDLIAVAWG